MVQLGHEAINCNCSQKNIVKSSARKSKCKLPSYKPSWCNTQLRNCETFFARICARKSICARAKAELCCSRESSHPPSAPLRAPPTSPNSASPQLLAPVQAVWDGLKAIGDPWNFIFSIFEIEVDIFDFKRDPTTVF